MRFKRIFVLFFSLIFIFGCVTVYNPATQREEFIFIDTPAEVQLGRDFSRQIEAELKVSEDPSLLNRINTIGQRVALVSDRKDLVYHFNVIENKEINAFAIPGGYIYVNTGLLNMASDDELACIMGHEIGHVAARHSVKAMQAALGYNLFMSILFSKEKYRSISQTGDILFNVIHLKYSREDEMLADKLGVKYAVLSKFNPSGMLTFLKKLKAKVEKEGESEGLLILRSHPYLDQRIEAITKEIDLIKKQ